MTRGRTFFVTGPPGCGKTTTAMLWSLRRAAPTFTLDWDTVSGVVAKTDHLRGHDSGDVSSQYRLAARVLAAWAATTTATGVDCVINVCVERNRADRSRVGPFAVPEAHVRASYEFAWDAWRDAPRAVVIDTSDMSHEEVVASLEETVAPLS